MASGLGEAATRRRTCARSLMSRILKILAPTRYPWRFNGPRQSRHLISNRRFMPFNKVSQKIEGVTLFNPFPLAGFDLVHAFNRIPLGRTPFIIGFESHLPRAFGQEGTGYYQVLSRMLAGKRCRAIVAISEYARRHFLRQHENDPLYDVLAAKLCVRYPNIPIPPRANFAMKPEDGLRLLFIGNHFARKGGLVAVRLAELARQRNMPLLIDIVSSLEVGAVSWTDPLRREFFDRYLKPLHSLPTIRCHGSLPNEAVLSLLNDAHFLLLPTFSDTFGFSAIEAMARSVPAIATAQGALPEFIRDGENGLLLPLETDAVGEWRHVAHAARHTPAYEAMIHEEVERLAEEAYTRLELVLRKPEAYLAMRGNAYATAEAMFSASDANRFWDDFYCTMVER